MTHPTRNTLALVLLALLLAACAPAVPTVDSTGMPLDFTMIGDLPAQYTTGTIVRTIDSEAGVVCWVYTAWQRPSISCLPLSETALEPHP